MKKSLLLLLLAVFLAPWTISADELTLNEGTATNSYIPIYGLYTDTQGTNSEFILSEETDGLSDLVGATITKLTFYISNSPDSWGSPVIQLYMGEVNETTISALHGPSGFTVVSSSVWDNTQSELEIELTDPYVYEGGNLLIGAYVQTKSNYKSTYFLGINTTTSGVSRYNSGSGTGTAQSFLPKVTFEYTPGAGATCDKPSSLEVSDITATGATLTWADGSGLYNVEYKKATDADWTVALSNTEQFSTNLTLDPATAYQVHVQSVCGDETSTWKSVSFETPCAEYNIPYQYGFEDASSFSCWHLIAGAAIDGTSSNAHTGSKYLKFSGTTSNMIALPEFTAELNTLRLEFWTRPESTGGSSGKFSVGYMTDITDVNTFVAIETYNSSEMTTSYVKKIIDFNDAPANAHIALRQFDCSTYYYWYVDDIAVKEIPSCLAPTGLNADNITTSSADLSWTEGGSESEWIIYYKKSGEDSFTEVANVTENPYTLEGLDASSTYQFYVKAVCSATEESEASDIASFATACDAIVIDADHPYSENFDNCDASTSYTPSANYLPLCWAYINECTYSSYKWYPLVDSYSSSNAHSGSKYLKFYSYYSSWFDYDPQPQYAVLPQMDDLDSKQLVLYARGYNASSSIIIGRMSDPADVSTFSQIAEQTLTATYAEYEFNLAGVDGDYIAIKIDAASSDRTYNGAYIDDIVVREAPSCIKPSNLAVDASGLTATLSWESEDGNFSIAHATSAEADPDENVLPEEVSDKSYEMSDLDLGNHYFWVRTDCSDTEHSEWAGPVSVHIGYCEPNPSSVDGDGISNVTFGLGDKVVNHNTVKATYTDCSDQIGAVQAGVESTIAITYETGYTYGTIIWVDLDKDLAFEENEILYTGTSTDDDPTTLNATITIPATQDVGDYRMRIGGADSGFDSYIGGSSATAPNPCYTGSYAVFQDYTLRVLEAPSCLPVSGLTLASVETNSASFYWTPGASETQWQYACVAKDADPVWSNENIVSVASASVSGLNANSSYDFYVRAYCDSENQSEAIMLNFRTDCEAFVVDADHSFFEGFEDATFAPFCWDTIKAGSYSWSRSTSYKHSGSASAYSGYYGDIYLILPDIQIADITEDVLLTFWSYNSYVSAYDKNSVVLLDGVNETELWTPTSVLGSWEETSINLNAYKGQTISLAFKYEGDDAHGWYIDDVSIRSNISIAINASRYATYYNEDDAYIMPNGLVGHIFNASDKLIQKYEEDDVVPAGVPLVLEGDEGNYQLIPTMANGVAPTETTNDLIGNNEAGIIGSATDGYVYYVLSMNASNEPESVGFYYMLDEGKGGFSMPAHKAYLKYTASSAPARFYLFNGENGATWLENLQGVEGTVKFMHEGNIYILRDSIIYDATGRKVRELK